MPPRDYYLPQRRLVSQEDASLIERARVPRSVFTGSWTRKTTFDAGVLVPILVEEILPGDHMTYEVTAYVRMATPLFPMFDNQRVDTFFFFVPNRLIWTNWARFMGEQATPSTDINILVPTSTSPVDGYPVGSLHDHMGLPVEGNVQAGETLTHNNLPLRAYNLIWNAWFRDENLNADAAVDMDNGPDDPAAYNLLRRAKPHDYFTSALPWAQKFTAPTIPVGGLAPIIGLGGLDEAFQTGPLTTYETGEAGSSTYAFFRRLYDNTAGDASAMEATGTIGDSRPLVFADLSQATGVAVNLFRQAWLVQSLLERDARGGTRYVELIRSHFGVINPDFRLQRPEYIGGGQTPLQLTPIAQTAPDAGGDGLGALGAAGTAAGSHRASYAATEHGYIIGLINVRSELSYQQGLHRMWSRSTRYDFYFPSLAGLGEQAILRKELAFFGDAISSGDEVFGYQERWHEYRTRYSEVVSDMRTASPNTLDAWHLAQNITSPVLDDTFIADLPPMGRVLAAGSAADNQQYLADILFRRRAVRPLPTFGTPATLGRF